MNENFIETLTTEIDVLKDYTSQVETNIQNLFNFYLTFVTALVGGSVVLFQFSPVNSPANPQWIITGLLLFSGVIGSLYTGSISHRYAHLGRFSQGLDELLRCLLKPVRNQLPDVYSQFLDENIPEQPSLLTSLAFWFRPVGTYHFSRTF